MAMTLTLTSSARCIACGADVTGAHDCRVEEREPPRLTELERLVFELHRTERIKRIVEAKKR